MKVPPLTALSYAAILTVYAAGYERTREAADRFLVDVPLAQPYDIPLPNGTTLRAAGPIAALPSMGPARTTGPARSAPEAVSTAAPAARVPALERSAAPEAPAAAAPAGPAMSAPVPERSIASADITPAPAPAIPAPAAEPAVAPAPPAAPVTPPAPVAAPPPIEPPAPVVLKTGKFLGWGSCRHGDIEAEVQINRGLIIDVKVTQCRVQYSCGTLAQLTDRIIEFQRPTSDYVAGATQSTIAFYAAIFSAIDKAK